MKHAACDRAWQVEASRDGRLEGAARAALAPHLSSCAVCRSEQQQLDALASSLCECDTVVDEMALRRLRLQTLEKANALFTAAAAPRHTRRRAHWLLAACATVTVAANALWFASAHRESRPKSAVSVVADEQTEWQRSLDRDVERVDLSAGTLLIRVARRPSDPRLVVRVPDGVIEDLGTVFSVSVHGGRTSEIAVREGDVLFHRRGAPPLHLMAGSTWTPREDSAPALAAPGSGPAEPAKTDVRGAPPAMQKFARQQRRASHPSRANRTTAQRGHETSDSGEDEAYLHILALLREGRSDEARLAALAYLKTYPAGFRRVEVSRVASSY
jgi:hypothetical protein